MPEILKTAGDDRKRKREQVAPAAKPRKAPKTVAHGGSTQAEILQLEEQILESQEHYGNIATLQSYVDNVEKKPKAATLAAVTLCRVFCRLIASEQLVKNSGSGEADGKVAHLLKQRLRDCVDSLAGWIGSPDATQESTALTLLMRIVKEETSQGTRRSEQAWRTEKSTFMTIVRSLLENPDAEAAREEFVEKYVDEYDDVRFYTMLAMKQYYASPSFTTEASVSDAIHLLSSITRIPSSQHGVSTWYGQEPENKQVLALSSQRRMAQECWLVIFRAQLTAAQRKSILNITTRQILPWFEDRMEILSDFLTDSFDSGGNLSLLALSGIFKLMTQRNLDYPDFYPKLYSLLNADLLHSKHRSRFFRYMDQFMSSSHLPAAMVASFIKRLSRLSLQAPPGAIVWIIPWVYNMMGRHPSCTFMLHRPYHPKHPIYINSPHFAENGVADPFLPKESDPMKTNAIESSLWELETLQDHWHPNVATLAKILAEQFTKKEYLLEDFADHGYGTLIDGELGRELGTKKVVEVEWEIPKRIVTAEGEEGAGLNNLGRLHEKAIEAM